MNDKPKVDVILVLIIAAIVGMFALIIAHTPHPYSAPARLGRRLVMTAHKRSGTPFRKAGRLASRWLEGSLRSAMVKTADCHVHRKQKGPPPLSERRPKLRGAAIGGQSIAGEVGSARLCDPRPSISSMGG